MLAAKYTFILEDGTRVIDSGFYRLGDIILRKGELQKRSGQKVVGHHIEFISLDEFNDKDYWRTERVR